MAAYAYIIQYQNLTFSELTGNTFDLLISDPDARDTGDSSLLFTPARIAQLQAQPATRAGYKPHIISYLSIGEAENFRSYWQPSWGVGNPSWILQVDPGFAGDFYVKFWDAAWVAICQQRVTDAVNAGFNGVFFDVVDSYANSSAVIAAAGSTAQARLYMKSFITTLSQTAKALNPNFRIIINNGIDMFTVNPDDATSATDTNFMAAIDGSFVEATFYDDPNNNDPSNNTLVPWTAGNEAYLNHAISSGKTVLSLDYPSGSSQRLNFIALALAQSYIPFVSDVALDTLITTPNTGIPAQLPSNWGASLLVDTSVQGGPSLTGKTPAGTYKDLLQMANGNKGLDTTLRPVRTGDGTASPLQLSKDTVNVDNNFQFGRGAYISNPAGLALDGVTDDTAALNAALSAMAANGGGVLYLASKKGINISGVVQVPSFITLDFTACAIKNVSGAGSIQVLGSASATAPTLSDTTAGSAAVTVSSATGLAVGQYVHLQDNAVSDGSNLIHNEIGRINAISGTTVTLEHNTFHTYLNANAAKLTVINPILNTKVIGARMTYVGTDSDQAAYPFRLKWAVNCEFIDCEVGYFFDTNANASFGPTAMGFRLEYSLFSKAVRCMYIGKPDASFYTSALGYGFVLQGSTMCKVLECTSRNARHGVLLQYGCAGNEVASHHDIDSRISGIDLHGVNAIYNHIHDNYIQGGPWVAGDATTYVALKVGNTTHLTGDHFNVIEDNHCVNGYKSGSGAGIQVLSASHDNIIRNNTIVNFDTGLKLVANSGDATLVMQNNTIKGNVFKNCTTCWNVDGGASNIIQHWNFEQNISDSNNNHFVVKNAVDVTLYENLVRNPTAASGVYGISATNVTSKFKAYRNVLDGCNRGIFLQQSPNAVMIDNYLTNLLESVVLLDSNAAGNNNGFIFEENSYAGTTSPTHTINSTGTTVTERG